MNEIIIFILLFFLQCHFEKLRDISNHHLTYKHWHNSRTFLFALRWFVISNFQSYQKFLWILYFLSNSAVCTFHTQSSLLLDNADIVCLLLWFYMFFFGKTYLILNFNYFISSLLNIFLSESDSYLNCCYNFHNKNYIYLSWDWNM